MDTWLFLIINGGMANPLFDILMPAVTHQGYLLVLPVIPYLLYLGYRSRNGERTFLPAAAAAVLIALLAVPLADRLGDQLKAFIARPRPGDVLEGVRLLVNRPSSFSMPSSHAITSFAFATPLFLLSRPFVPLPWRLCPLALAGLVAFSRCYVGVHYPSDVLAGGVLGAAFASGLCWIYRKGEGWMRNSP